MNRVYTRHIVGEMDQEMVQRCIICGEAICDYRNAAWPAGQSSPPSWPTGEVYVSDGNPRITVTTKPEEEVFNCQ